jgi:secondary thiamine-phosphate synthase enzyme
MTWTQVVIQLRARERGCHLITSEVVHHLNLNSLRVGLVHLFLQHTSAALTLNENCDVDVRRDMEMHLNTLVPEDAPYTHTMEGKDDMPAHIKSSLLGVSLTIPIRQGKLALGTWQGIWLCEARNHGGRRTILATIQGE